MASNKYPVSTSPQQFGYFSSGYATNPNQSRVLGASTSSIPTQSFTPWQNASMATQTQAPYSPTKNPTPSGGGGGGGGGGTPGTVVPNSGGQQQQSGNGEPDYSQQISEMYAPYAQEAANAEKAVQEGKAEDEKNLLSRYDQSLGQYQEEGQNLLSDTETEQNTFQKVIQSALSEAMRAYSAMQQQKQARFGGISSAGQAIGELAQQEFFKQQGNVNTKLAEGTEAFGKEKIKIKQYVDNKVKDLGLWKEEAITTLNKTFRDSLLAIQARRNDIEANKTRDKLALLQDATDRARQIRDQDKALRQEIAMAAVNQLQTVSGRAFTPAELNQYMSEYGMGLGSDAPTNIGVNNTSTNIATTGYKPKTADELLAMNPIASTNA